MSGISYRTAWRKADSELEQHAKEFWRVRRRLPSRVNPVDRARELCAVAIHKDHAVGVSTATLERVPEFRCRMAVYRCAVTHALRHAPLSWRITEYSHDVLEKWSLENPDEKVMGLMAVIQSRELILRYPQVFAPANMIFTGFDPAGFPIRVSWFKHATIPTDWPPRASRQNELPEASCGPRFPLDEN